MNRDNSLGLFFCQGESDKLAAISVQHSAKIYPGKSRAGTVPTERSSLLQKPFTEDIVLESIFALLHHSITPTKYASQAKAYVFRGKFLDWYHEIVYS
jgi:hypothetical protein